MFWGNFCIYYEVKFKVHFFPYIQLFQLHLLKDYSLLPWITLATWPYKCRSSSRLYILLHWPPGLSFIPYHTFLITVIVVKLFNSVLLFNIFFSKSFYFLYKYWNRLVNFLKKSLFYSTIYRSWIWGDMSLDLCWYLVIMQKLRIKWTLTNIEIWRDIVSRWHLLSLWIKQLFIFQFPDAINSTFSTDQFIFFCPWQIVVLNFILP